MIDINELKALCKESSIAVTKHAKDRMMERKIGISDVVSHDGEFIYLITAYYPDRKIWNEDLKSRKETN